MLFIGLSQVNRNSLVLQMHHVIADCFSFPRFSIIHLNECNWHLQAFMRSSMRSDLFLISTTKTSSESWFRILANSSINEWKVEKGMLALHILSYSFAHPEVSDGMQTTNTQQNLDLFHQEYLCIAHISVEGIPKSSASTNITKSLICLPAEKGRVLHPLLHSSIQTSPRVWTASFYYPLVFKTGYEAAWARILIHHLLKPGINNNWKRYRSVKVLGTCKVILKHIIILWKYRIPVI